MTALGKLLTGLFFVYALILAASYFDQVWWGFEMLSHLRVQYAAAAGVFAAIFLMRRAYVMTAAAAILLIVNLVPVFPYLFGGFQTAQARGGDAPLRVMIFNLHQQQADLDALRRLIRRETPDLVLITEFETEPTLFLRDLDDILPHRAGSPRAGLFRLLLLSRFPVADMRLHRPSLTFLPILEARLCKTPSDCFTLLGLHAARPGGVGTVWRDRMLDFVAARAAADTDGRVIVMGDLNAAPWSRAIARLLRVGGLTDAAIGSPFRSTWTSRIPVFGLPLDHVLVGRGIGVVGRRVAGSIQSDHFPVIADLNLPAARPTN